VSSINSWTAAINIKFVVRANGANQKESCFWVIGGNFRGICKLLLILRVLRDKKLICFGSDLQLFLCAKKAFEIWVLCGVNLIHVPLITYKCPGQ
jgi:hypothetical protein